MRIPGRKELAQTIARSCGAAGAACLVLLAVPAMAVVPVPGAGGWQLATGLGAGAVSPDQKLADYRWDTRPAGLFSAEAMASRGRFAVGLRYSRWGTTQATGLTATDITPEVRLDNLEFIGQFRAATVAGFQVWGSATAGRVGIAYTPDQVVIATAAPTADIAVNYDPLDTLQLGFGLAIQRQLGRNLVGALRSDWSGFELDASHRRGAEIVSGPESFVNWSLRLQVSWTLNLS